MSRAEDLLAAEWPCACTPAALAASGMPERGHLNTCDQVVALEVLIQLFEHGFAVVDLRDESLLERMAIAHLDHHEQQIQEAAGRQGLTVRRITWGEFPKRDEALGRMRAVLTALAGGAS